MNNKVNDLEHRIDHPIELSPEQISAIIRGIKLGRQIQLDIPQIADGYEEGLSHKELVENYDILSRYGVSEEIARVAIRLAIRGHLRGFGVKPYDGLIADSNELEKLRLAHLSKGGKKIYEQGRGVHGRTDEQHSEDGYKGGLITGHKNYEQRLGIHGRTDEQHRYDSSKGGHKTYEKRLGAHALTPENKRKSGLKSILNQGKIPWVEGGVDGKIAEIECAYKLSQLLEYQRGSLINLRLIANKINEGYHNNNPVRNPEAVGSALQHYKKKIR